MRYAIEFGLSALEPRTLFASLSGLLWNDLNQSGAQEAGELPFAGWTAYLDSNRNGALDAGERTAVTNGRGVYTFAGLAAGSYNVGVVKPAGYGQSTPGRTGAAEGGFDIDLIFSDEVSPAVRSIFVAAAQKWESVVTADLPAFTAEDGTAVDDLLISVSITDIDGLGGTLAQAGPDEYRTRGSKLPAVGSMEFDTLDVDDELSTGEFYETVLHEMAHVLGFGVVWEDLGLLSGASGEDPRFTGAAAVRAYQTLFNTRDTRGVPVEASGGEGTALSHWSDDLLQEELMTGYASEGINDPLSAITVGSLQDIGYTVNTRAADTWNPASQAVRLTTGVDLGATAFGYVVTVGASDTKTTLDFGMRTNTAPKIGAFVVPTVAAVGQTITLSAGKIFDAEGDRIAAVSFWREANGTPGLQKGAGGDVFIGSKTVAKRGAFAIETSTTGLSIGQQAYYAVATDSQLAAGRKGAVVNLIAMPPRPAMPGAVQAVSTSGSTAVVSWTDSGNETGYRLQVATRSDFARDALVRTVNLPADTTQSQVTGLTPGARYYYRVRAYNIGGASGYATVPGAVQQRGANEILIDNQQAAFTGTWATRAATAAYGGDYRVNTSGRGTATFSFDANRSGSFALYLRWPASSANASVVSIGIVTGGRSQSLVINQSTRGDGWVYVGSFDLQAGAGAVVINARGAAGTVVADAIRFL